jgi:hypothetical protein
MNVMQILPKGPGNAHDVVIIIRLFIGKSESKRRENLRRLNVL